MKPYRVLLYYIYSPIENPEQYREEHHLLCLRLNLLGRIIVAPEGLNGTVSGLTEDCEAYMAALQADPRFAHTEFKIDESEGHAFQKLHVRVKAEIVHSDLGVDPLKQTGIHLEPEEFKQLKNDPDVVLVDMRSNYEHEVGKFKGAITFDMDNLRELPEHIAEIEHLKGSGKKIVTYCTGGIKCEKASAYLLSQGFENVYQLHGGIIKYGIESGGEDFDGECYVFDNRVTVPVNHINPVVVSTCYRCGTSTSRMINCASPVCNNHVTLCEDCGNEHIGTCSDACKEDPNLRPYNGTGYYGKQTQSYSPIQGYKSRQGQKVDVAL
ncbi:oxygen-dependent tRNA uridine(34) hydroxylase TrhO [Spirosoma foliorum]|uniref:tRNA uridine(34) hydroxylase n=1 Tax=Spirosoma foliorum TaxID=2710596 RepID=A0A7G5GZU5_9BACT|nr:rhodanese-related sulfurtransferase [Spirosoma foliorum]QMW04387.1 rhodanese-related sulfurtransferase [Spirosoma foliorum]